MKQLPLKNAYITLPYGIKSSNYKCGYHAGVDLVSTSKDTEVVAIEDGMVINVAYEKNGYGNYACVQNNDGIRTFYCHLQNARVVEGQIIYAGDLVGIEGTTGKSSGVHLHLEARQSPYYYGKDDIDVAKYLGIKNQKGTVTKMEMTKEEKIDLIKREVGYDDNTMLYFQFYRYSDALIDKLVKRLQE